MAVPSWPSSPYEPAPYVQRWEESYRKATAELGGASDPKAILQKMRVDLDAA